jgi:hypothetical protein
MAGLPEVSMSATFVTECDDSLVTAPDRRLAKAAARHEYLTFRS